MWNKKGIGAIFDFWTQWKQGCILVEPNEVVRQVLGLPRLSQQYVATCLS